MPNIRNNLTVSELNDQLVNLGVESVVAYLIGSENYQVNGKMLSMSCCQGGKKGSSFQINTTGVNAGNWFENNMAESPNAIGRGDLVELWMLNRDLSKGAALKEIKEYLGDSPIISNRPYIAKHKLSAVKKSVAKVSNSLPASQGTLDKYQGRLRQSHAAKSYLYSRGLTDETIEYFKLGLSTAYTGADHVVRQDALVSPIITTAGFMKPYVYYNIPNVTMNPIDSNGWCKGAPRLGFNTTPTVNHQFLFVAEGFKDLWMLHQQIQGTSLAKSLLIATSTHGSRIPAETQNNPQFFNAFEKVFLGHDKDKAGEAIAMEWASFAGLKSYRIAPPFSIEDKNKDWTDFFAIETNNNNVFADLLSHAHMVNPVKLTTKVKLLQECQIGEILPPASLDVTSAFFNGLMYYSIKVMQTSLAVDGSMGLTECIKVLRSDKRILEVLPIKQGTLYTTLKTQMYQLSDGTIIKRVPQVAASASWDWDSAYAWVTGKLKPRPLSHIVDDMVSVMKSRVWLPNVDDYTTLALTMVTTYVQQVFDAIPFLLATGVAGSGKTELGRILQELGCNSVVTGDISAATITRLIDQTKGFLIIDDAEKLSKGGKGSNGAIDDLLQILKVSYKKSSATRQVTDSKTMTVSELDFYGVKLFTNTTGMEDILGTRTISIQTRKPTNNFKQSEMPFEQLKALRAELHAWAMEDATTVDSFYRQYSVSNRDDEITTPFRIFADMAKRQDWHELIDNLIKRMKLERSSTESESPVGYLREAMLNLARRGYTSVTLEHVLLEMELLVPDNFGKTFTTEIPEWTETAWIKRQLIQMAFLEEAAGTKVRVGGVAIRPKLSFHLSEALFQEIRKASQPTYDAIMQGERIEGKNFCRQYNRCLDCPYYSVPCKIRELKIKP